MARGARSIARVRLARSMPRLLAAPVLLLLAGAALAVGGVLAVGGLVALAMVAAGAVMGLVALVLAAIPLSVRVHVEESLVRVTSLLGRQVYLLTPGSLNRAHLRGRDGAQLHARFGVGWALGRAVLYGDEPIHVVRLAPTESMILIPTSRGRLGLATSNEPHLIEALTHAAQARAERAELAEAAPERAPEPVAAAEAPPPAPMPAPIPAPSGAGAVAQPPSEEPAAGRRPSWARRGPGLPSVSIPTMGVAERVRALPRPRPRPSWLLVLVPLAAAGVAWGAATYLGRMPATGTADARIVALALVLAGPATAIGAVMARTWWPRILGVVISGGLAATVLIGRALLM